MSLVEHTRGGDENEPNNYRLLRGGVLGYVLVDIRFVTCSPHSLLKQRCRRLNDHSRRWIGHDQFIQSSRSIWRPSLPWIAVYLDTFGEK